MRIYYYLIRGSLIWYLALAGLILGPLLVPGYILTFDMSWTPQLPAPSALTNSWPFYQTLHLLGLIVPSMVLQKILLVSIFVLAGLGTHRLVQMQLSREGSGDWPALWAGVLYTVNPFTYTRLMAGQYLVLLGYALLPWFVRSLWRLLEQPTWRRALGVGVWAAVISCVSIHSVGYMILLGALIVGARATRGVGSWLHATAPWLALAVGAWVVLSSYWLVPLLTGNSRSAQLIAGFDAGQFDAYATSAGAVGAPLSVLSLQGFWVDPLGRYLLPSDTGALFWIALAGVWALVATGLWRSVRRRDPLALALALAGAAAWVLALGAAWAPSAGINHWLVEHLPYYRGYREPQKWVAVLALAYAYLGALGLAALSHRLSAARLTRAASHAPHDPPAGRSPRVAPTLASRTRRWVAELVPLVACLLPLALAPMLLAGTGGQLRSTPYPASWQELRDRVDQLAPGRIVLFPWHQYLYLDFAGRTVANPIPAYLGRSLIASDDPELAGVLPPRAHSDSRIMADDILPGRYFRTDLADQFRRLDARYIVLLKQADWLDYNWLDRQDHIHLLAETSGWKLYQIQDTP